MEKKKISSEPKWKEIKKMIMETSESTFSKKKILKLMQKRRLEKYQKVIRRLNKVKRRKFKEAKSKGAFGEM